jgi:hypothetical protein
MEYTPSGDPDGFEILVDSRQSILTSKTDKDVFFEPGAFVF